MTRTIKATPVGVTCRDADRKIEKLTESLRRTYWAIRCLAQPMTLKVQEIIDEARKRGN